MQSKYQIIMPFVLRGLLIHLMNDNLDDVECFNDLQALVENLENILNSQKDANTFFERYLT